MLYSFRLRIFEKYVVQTKERVVTQGKQYRPWQSARPILRKHYLTYIHNPKNIAPTRRDTLLCKLYVNDIQISNCMKHVKPIICLDFTKHFITKKNTVKYVTACYRKGHIQIKKINWSNSHFHFSHPIPSQINGCNSESVYPAAMYCGEKGLWSLTNVHFL